MEIIAILVIIAVAMAAMAVCMVQLSDESKKRTLLLKDIAESLRKMSGDRPGDA